MNNIEVRTMIDIIILLIFSWGFGVNAQGCGETLIGHGRLSSPNYPYAYNNNARCLWTLNVPACSSIELHFRAFSTESCCDFLTVYNGTNTSAEYAFRYKGSISPFTLVLGSNAVVVFSSDASVGDSGFHAEVISVIAQGKFWCSQSQQCLNSPARCNGVQNCYPYGEDEIGCINSTTSAGCGGTLSGHGNLSSPNYPYAYNNNARCLWNLNALACSSIQLQFYAFFTESCCDFLAVYNGTNTSGEYAFWYKGIISPFTLVLGSNAVVLFSSDGSAVDSGFYVEFTSVIAQGKFWCSQSQQCLNSSARCNGVQNCYPYGEDEIGCINSTTSAAITTNSPATVATTTNAPATCINAGYYWCYQSLHCVYWWQARCNGEVNCYPYGEDEIGCGATTTTRATTTNSPTTVATTTNAPATCINAGYYWCNRSNYCSYSWLPRCNGYENCSPYGEDEIGCGATTTMLAVTTNAAGSCINSGYYWCTQSNYCTYSGSARCNGETNCYPYGEDERDCSYPTTYRWQLPYTHVNFPSTGHHLVVSWISLAASLVQLGTLIYQAGC